VSDTEFLRLAYEAAKRSNCLRRKTGAVLVVDGFSLILACNGTPENTVPCSEGGCPRCASDTPQLQGYDSCACVHAEVSIVAIAARMGISTKGSTVFCTLRPCLGCLKTLIQAGVNRVVFCESYSLETDLEELWHRLASEAGMAVIREPVDPG
jgi:dCMP deaminase